MSAHDVDYLFRFRDLIAKTLDAHRAIIDAHGKCWWGWWKRPHERGHADVWSDLTEKCRAGGGAWIGLFDSGCTSPSVAVWGAHVVDVRPPVDGGVPSLDDVRDRELIPEYYRASPFSRAWLQLDVIEPQPIADFFSHYSYRREPVLRGLLPEQLQHLRDKQIVDPDELKLMDTTIWSVRPSRDEDPRDKFLTPQLRVSKPLSSEPIPVRGNAILHLTDMHFAAGDDARQHCWDDDGENALSTRIQRALDSAELSRKIGVVIVTGDSVFDPRHGKTEFDKAARAINKILGTLELDEQNLVIVPGNHDVAWTRDDDERFDDGHLVASAPTEATKGYREFYRSLMRHEPDPHLAMARRFVFESGILVDVCGLNSSNLESGKSYLNGMGRVGSGVFEGARSALQWNETNASTALRVLALHHHLTNAEDVEDPIEFYKGFGMAIDAKQVLREAALVGVHLVLHGHRHREFLWREHVYMLPEENNVRWNLGEVSIVGGGSAGSTASPSQANFFRVIEMDRSWLCLHSFRSKQSSFIAMKRWRAPLDFEDGRLRLGEWNPDRT